VRHFARQAEPLPSLGWEQAAEEEGAEGPLASLAGEHAAEEEEAEGSWEEEAEGERTQGKR